ncbi:MAG: NAD-dependent epimerase/dehydratase family protein, partial [Thermoleophilaceae bacterium]
LARRHGIELVTLRYFTVYGPRQRPDMAFARFVGAALDGSEMPLLGDGRQRRDFTYVGDAVEATALALERGRPGAVYNVAGGRPVAVAHALRLLGDALGRAPELAARPADAREPRSTAADLGRARSELGWHPHTPLELGLRRQVEHAAAAAVA